jgi:protein-L-isoaspartate O-methyltransferase
MSDFYSKNAKILAERYESLLPEDVNHNWLHFVLAVKSTVLDVGAGSGRDAAWFAGQGHDVVAVEPAGGLRKIAQKLHPLPNIEWINDRLPGLKKVYELGQRFDIILVNAVWMHIPLWEREKSFEALTHLLNPGGRLVMTLRHGPITDARRVYPTGSQELHRFSGSHGLKMVLDVESKDLFGRKDVSWTTVVIRHPEG